jgi:hypothetical protein
VRTVRLDARLRKLEGWDRGREPCPECGWADGEPDEPCHVDVVWNDRPPEDELEEEFCSQCGRQISFHIVWE